MTSEWFRLRISLLDQEVCKVIPTTHFRGFGAICIFVANMGLVVFATSLLLQDGQCSASGHLILVRSNIPTQPHLGNFPHNPV